MEPLVCPCHVCGTSIDSRCTVSVRLLDDDVFALILLILLPYPVYYLTAFNLHLWHVFTSAVLVGQPFETLKTLTQVQSTTTTATLTTKSPSLLQTATTLYQSGGIKAFYRGGVPLLIGGGLMRSAQFGVYNRLEVCCTSSERGFVERRVYSWQCTVHFTHTLVPRALFLLLYKSKPQTAQITSTYATTYNTTTATRSNKHTTNEASYQP